MSRRDRIREKIESRSHYEDRGYRDPETGEPSPCRIWNGPKSGAGYKGKKKGRGHSYGRMNLDGGTVAVHIAAWVNENGLIPPRKQLDHLCHQRDCSEERHLRLKTHKQNQRNKKPRPTGAEIMAGLDMEHGGVRTGRFSSGPMPWMNPDDWVNADTIIGHGIPADRLPQPAPEVMDE